MNLNSVIDSFENTKRDFLDPVINGYAKSVYFFTDRWSAMINHQSMVIN